MRWRVLLLCLAAVLVVATLSTRAIQALSAQTQTGGGYDLTWNTIDGGGYMYSTGGGYSLGGTIGQPDAGLLSGGVYTVAGGFWSNLPGHETYLPVIVRP